MWPAIIVASPFIIVHELIFGSDSGAKKDAQAKANEILDASKDQIPVRGLYLGSINLRWALYGLFVESRLPFVEINTHGSAWLLSLARDPKPLISSAEQHKFIRLSLGKQGDSNCFNWTESWDKSHPVRPGTCLLITFDDELQSDVQLSVDASKVNKRVLYWELADRATGKRHLSVPFWESQTEGQPLQVYATYRGAHEDYTFIRVIRKLSPAISPLAPGELPFIMNRFERRPSETLDGPVVKIVGEFRLPILPKTAEADVPKNESWSDGYERARSTGKPVIMNNYLLIVPRDDKVGAVCVETDGLSCSFAGNFISDIGVLTSKHTAAYQMPETMRSPLYAVPLKNDMYVTVAARGFDRKLLWIARIQPESFPANFQQCSDLSRGCYFYPTQINKTAEELVVRGILHDGSRGDATRGEFELVVPLGRIVPAQTH